MFYTGIISQWHGTRPSGKLTFECQKMAENWHLKKRGQKLKWQDFGHLFLQSKGNFLEGQHEIIDLYSKKRSCIFVGGLNIYLSHCFKQQSHLAYDCGQHRLYLEVIYSVQEKRLAVYWGGLTGVYCISICFWSISWINVPFPFTEWDKKSLF